MHYYLQNFLIITIIIFNNYLKYSIAEIKLMSRSYDRLEIFMNIIGIKDLSMIMCNT
jgi:hypothetical protein